MLAAEPDEAHRHRAEQLGVAPSKITVPWMRPGLVWRTSLVKRLLDEQAPIVAVIAPAGYGKTTLLSQWCEQSGRGTAWVSLAEADNSPPALLRAVAAALDGVEPLREEVVPKLVTPAASESAPLHVVASFVSELRTPFVLVLDNFEVLHSAASLDLVRELALSLPQGSQLALASRSELDARMARPRAEGRIAELRGNELRLDHTEARCLLEASGVTLDDDALADLVDRTEGWATGVYLAALARRSPLGEAAPEVVSGNDRFLADYLRTELLDRLAPDLRRFLIRTSVVERLCGPLCDALVQSTGSQRVLEELEAANLLIVPLDRTRQWYRYHHLLQELLRAELTAYLPDEVPDLHARAADWYSSAGLTAEAVTHLQAAGDEQRAGVVVASSAVALYASGQAELARRWITWFDRRGVLHRHPEVAVMGGLLELLSGNASAALRFAEAAEHPDHSGMPPDGSPMESWIGVLRAAMGRGGVHQILADGTLAVEDLAPGSPLRPGAFAFLALGHLLAGDAASADRTFALAAEASAASGEMSALSASLAMRAALAIQQRDWAAAATHSARAVQIVEDGGLGEYLTTLAVFAVASRVAAHRGDAREAAALAARAQRLRPLCTYALASSGVFLVQLAHAHLEMADPAGARSVLRQVREFLLLSAAPGVLAGQADAIEHALASMGTGTIGVSSLTTSELRILPFLATHLTLREIAERLYLSRHTVKTHALSIYRKVGASSRAEAVEHLSAAGLLDAGTATVR